VPVAIVGAGFAGTMLAAQLARRSIDSILIEFSGRAGLGTAFSTRDPAHLLNIPAETMGAWAEAPDDFAEREGIERGAYAERRRFGCYLHSILDDAIGSGHAHLVEDRAVAAVREPNEWRLELAGGDSIQSDALVLATGNAPPAALASLSDIGDRMIDDPWGERARRAVDDAAAHNLDVLILGTSLTMIDVVLSLDSAGHKGRTVALSRRGKIPLSNGADEPAPVEWSDVPKPRVRDIARWLRRRSAKVGWRPAVDSLRPHSHRLWQSLPLQEKRLFLRRGRPWWDVHRHRIAPEIACKVDRLIHDGRLEVVAGRIVAARNVNGRVEVTIRKRGIEIPQPAEQFGYVFNCTGPLHAIEETRDPLLRSLLDSREARPDELGVGLEVDENSRAGERLWALGSLTKGRYWEIIAVPDIRTQAAAVAEDIALELP
jgi:uncharacterized NAD(P)/FAD-binding protein YdhS